MVLLVRWFLYKSLRGYTGFVLLGCGILVCFLYHSHTVFLPPGESQKSWEIKKTQPEINIFSDMFWDSKTRLLVIHVRKRSVCIDPLVAKLEFYLET